MNKIFLTLLLLPLKSFSAQDNQDKYVVIKNYLHLTTKYFALDFHRLLHNEKVETVEITIKKISTKGKNQQITFDVTPESGRLFFNPKKREIVAIKVYLRDKTHARLKRNTEFMANKLYRYALDPKQYRIDVKSMQWVEALAGVKV